MRRHAKAVVAVLALLLTLALGAANAFAAAPVASIDPASEIGVTSAKATGAVNPEGKETSYHFQYISDAAFSVHQDAEQKLTIAATAGAYTLSFQGQSTKAIAFSASAATVEAELNALSSIGGVGGSVSVSGGPGDETGSAPYTIVFGGTLEETNVEQISADPTGLIGSASVETTVQGRAEGFEGASEAGNNSLPEGINVSTAVEPATLTGLTPATEYHLRLVASNEDGSDQAVAASFETDPATAPSLSVNPADPVAYTTATISGEVDPEGGNTNPIGPEVLPIFWQLQYALASEPGNWQLGKSDTIEATSSDPIPVSVDLANLSPDTEYDFRLIANYAGSLEEVSGEESFETLAVSAPSVSADEASSVGAFSAHFSGEVEVTNADPAFDASCAFDYITQAKYEAEGNSFTKASSIACDPNPVSGSETQPVEVQADPADLEPNTTYRLRLRAKNLGGETIDEAPATFKTIAIAPSVGKASHHQLGVGKVAVAGFVNPRNSAITDCEFAYGLTESYGSTAPCEALPPTDNEAHPVRAELSGLTPGATYHFQLSATSAAGTSESADASFTVRSDAAQSSCANVGSPGVGFLPDCRAWEMVSPPDKNGGGITPNSDGTRIADDGDAAQFGSLQGFADSIGSGVSFEYMAKRSTASDPGDSGWDTHAITPPQEPLGGFAALSAQYPSYKGYFSPDLSTGVFMAWSPLTSDPMVANVTNLYRRDDLLDPGQGSYELLSPCPLCVEQSNTPIPLFPQKIVTKKFFAGASADFSHVLFESQLGLVKGAALSPVNAYEYADGELRLVGVLPSGDAPPQSALGSGVLTGQNPRFAPRPISDDGSRIAFMVPDSSSFSGPLYMRINGRSTIQLNASEHSTPAAPEPARFWHISRDGTRAVLTSKEPLTDDAPEETEFSKLYMWERQSHDETQEVKVDASGGTFILSFNGSATSATGTGDLIGPVSATGDLTSGSEVIANLNTSSGNFAVGQALEGPGIPPATTITEVNPGSLTLSSQATESASGVAITGLASRTISNLSTSTGVFSLGQLVSGAGIAPNTTVTAVQGSAIEISAAPTATATGALLSAGTQLAFDAPPAQVDAALEQLDVVKAGNVGVTGGPGSYEVTFNGDFAGANVAQLQADSSGLTGGASEATVTTTQPVENLRLLGTGLNKAEDSGGDGVFGGSDDASYVYFTSKEQLDPIGPPLGNLVSGIYLWQEGEITYIGKASTPSADTFSSFYGTESVLQKKQSRVSPNGRGLLFVSSSGAGLLSAHGGTDYAHTGRQALYLYRADSDELECVSCNPFGEPVTAGGAVATRVLAGATPSDNYESRALSDDGRYVFFSTAEKLVKEDSNGIADAYIYDTQSGEPHLLSSGESNQPSYFMNSSADGRDAMFVTAEPLSGWDVDSAYDLYDARIDGGFPEPPPPPPSCQGDACQPAPLELNDATPGSSSVSGPGDPKVRRGVKTRCPKGKRRAKTRGGKARCVPKAKKRANNNRRAGK